MFEPMSKGDLANAKEGLEAEARKTLVMGKINEKLNESRERGVVEINWDELMSGMPKDVGRDEVERTVREMFASPESVWRAEIGEDAITLTDIERDPGSAN